GGGGPGSGQVPAGRGPRRNGAPGAGRLRGGPQAAGQPHHGQGPLDRRDCLRAGRGPPPLARSWLRAAFGQAGGPRHPATGAELLRRPEAKEWLRATLTREPQKRSDRHGEGIIHLVTTGGPSPAASLGRPGHWPPGGGRIPRWLRQRLGWAPGARTSGHRGRFGNGGRKLGPQTAVTGEGRGPGERRAAGRVRGKEGRNNRPMRGGPVPGP